MPASLIRSTVNRVRIVWIDGDVGDACVLADAENALPGLAAIGGFVEATLAARSPQRTLRCDVNDVRVFRIDRDAADVFGSSESDVAPRAPAVVRFINSVAVRD